MLPLCFVGRGLSPQIHLRISMENHRLHPRRSGESDTTELQDNNTRTCKETMHTTRQQTHNKTTITTTQTQQEHKRTGRNFNAAIHTKSPAHGTTTSTTVTNSKAAGLPVTKRHNINQSEHCSLTMITPSLHDIHGQLEQRRRSRNGGGVVRIYPKRRPKVCSPQYRIESVAV